MAHRFEQLDEKDTQILLHKSEIHTIYKTKIFVDV